MARWGILISVIFFDFQSGGLSEALIQGYTGGVSARISLG